MSVVSQGATHVGRRIRLPEEMGILVMTVVVAVFFGLLSVDMRSVSNGLVLLLNGSVIGFLALGQSFVLLTGGIELSTGSNIAMTGVLAAFLMSHGLPWPLAMVGAVAAGVCLGCINGLIVHFFKVPPFIVTFSTMGVAASIPLIMTGANSITITQTGFAVVGQSSLLGIPVPVVILAITAVLGALLLSRTVFGIQTYAVGGNREAARVSGVSLARVTIGVYALSGLCAGIAGMIDTSRLMVGFPATGTGNELFFSIAAAVVGGVSLFGGIGRIQGAMIGALLIAIVSDGMNVVNLSSYWQSLVIGGIVLTAVTFDVYRHSEKGRRFLHSIARVVRKRSLPEPDGTSRDRTLGEEVVGDEAMRTGSQDESVELPVQAV